jgi:hypothetical protein
MKCVVVPLYQCCIDVILCIFTICHTILPHDYTHSFRHPTICKIVQLSSHMLLSVIFTIINLCIYLGGAPCTNLENKTLLCSIINLCIYFRINFIHHPPMFVINHQKGEIESASSPLCGFCRIDDQQLDI